MKRYLGVSLAAAIVASCGIALVKSAKAAPRVGAVATQPVTPTEVGSARSTHRSHHENRYTHHRARVYVRGPYRPYYGRPDYYVPRPAPFFPFGFGYGLDPSW
jgi:hypothetical protein